MHYIFSLQKRAVQEEERIWAIPSLVPQPTCCWKWVGGTKGSKRAFFSLTAVFSAKNGSRLKNRTFLESPVCEFSENGFGSKKKLFSRPLDLETVLPPIWGGSPSNLGRFEKVDFSLVFLSDLSHCISLGHLYLDRVPI